MKITTVGIDLAKNVFQIHGIDQHSRPVVKKCLKRTQMLAFFAQLRPCLVGMEACGGAHYWARKLQAQGHTVKLMAPQFVKPYVKANKTDAADAEAICEAVTRPNMRFVPIKNADQQSVLSLCQRLPDGLVCERWEGRVSVLAVPGWQDSAGSTMSACAVSRGQAAFAVDHKTVNFSVDSL